MGLFFNNYVKETTMKKILFIIPLLLAVAGEARAQLPYSPELVLAMADEAGIELPHRIVKDRNGKEKKVIDWTQRSRRTTLEDVLCAESKLVFCKDYRTKFKEDDYRAAYCRGLEENLARIKGKYEEDRKTAPAYYEHNPYTRCLY
jgi:hypothetical protein